MLLECTIDKVMGGVKKIHALLIVHGAGVVLNGLVTLHSFPASRNTHPGGGTEAGGNMLLVSLPAILAFFRIFRGLRELFRIISALVISIPIFFLIITITGLPARRGCS